MSAYFKKLTLLIMLMALASNLYAQSAFADLLEPKCDMALMQNVDKADSYSMTQSDMDCDCGSCELDCQNGCLNTLNSTALALLPDVSPNTLIHVQLPSFVDTHALSSMTLKVISPPPTIG